MKNMTLFRNLLLAAVMAVGMTESSVAATSWFNGGVNANWPTDATGGEWYCQDIASLKWTETFIPGVDTTVPGVTLDNWAYVGLKFTATQALGLSDDVTEATFSTTVLLAPVLKEEMPSVDSADKGGVLLVHEDDGSLRYYVVAQNDETNGTGANVWKLASSIPRVTVDAAPVVIGIRFYRDGERWLVDYTVDGVTEPPHVVSFGSASTIDSVRFTGPCTVQSLSATFESQSTPPVDPTDEPVDPPDEPVDPPEEPTDEPTQMFYIGETGYDSWTDAYSAAKNGDTIKVGKGAELKHVSGTISKTLTIDLDGNTLTFVQGWLTGDAKIVDNGGTPGEGLFTMTAYSMNVGGGKLDLSALASDQVSGRFQMNDSSVVKFPSDRPLADCTSAINQKADGAQIVVQGVTYTYDGSAWISDSPVVTYSITITPPQNGTLTASATSDIAVGTTITVTATPATGYQLVSVTTNGAPITGTSFTMPAADVTLAATFEAQLTPPDDKAFYVNGKGYDSWSDAMNAAGNGGTVSLGADAEISGTQMYSLTIDLCGHTLTASSTSAPYIGGGVITVADSVGGGLFTVPNGMNLQGTIDLSALGHDQFAISGNRFWTGSATVAKFPAGWTIDECTATFRNNVVGSKIVVQGVTYTYDGSDWIPDSPVVTYSITITAPQNGTLETSVTNDVAAGTTVAVKATPNAGYQLVSVTTNGAPITGTSFTMPAADVTLAATFEELPSPEETYDITIAPSENGKLETSVTNDVAAETAVTVKATPNAGYQLASVTMNGVSVFGGMFTMPEQDVTLVATFSVVEPIHSDRTEEYPANIEDGKVVTYDADNAGDPTTLVPGKPYCVVDASGYGYEYVSTVTTSGRVFWFRDENDFRYNASAKIGDTYYLFLTDAVDAASSGATIEILRNNYAVEKTMTIKNKKLTVRGNGHVVKVAYPFMDNTGYVNPMCTDTPKTVFISENGDLRLEDMTVMGGGERLGPTGAGTESSSSPAVVVLYSGVVDMDRVTIRRSQGGLYVMASSKAHLKACNLVRNARYCGGGFYNLGVLVLEDSSLSENRSLSSGGSGAAGENRGLMVVNNCVICNNGSTYYGGAINNLNNYTGNSGVAYMMNLTMAGNFTSHRDDNGGGIGIQISSGDFYVINSLICNNYHYVTTSGSEKVEDSDIRSDVGNNHFLYSVYGVCNDKASSEFANCQTVRAADNDVFKGYSSFARTYEQSKVTQVSISGPTLENDPESADARYAPLYEGSKGDMGEEGVYTYFNASDWRSAQNNADVSWLKMSYSTKDGELQTLGNCAAASANDLVTTYYEASFMPDVVDRELGVVGASGFGTLKVMHTLYLLKNPVDGTVSDNLLLTGRSYNEGAEVSVVATPNIACSFVGWYDENDRLVSDKASYKFTMEGDKFLYAVFKQSEVVTLEVNCELAEKGTHTTFPLQVTRDWLAKSGLIDSEGATIDDAGKAAIEEALNAPDGENGLNHVWMNYVLGAMEPGDEDGRIWIRGEQTRDPSTLRFRMQEFSQTQGCGFSVRFRLPAKSSVDDDFVRGSSYSASSSFDAQIASDTLTHRVIDMIFVPDGYDTSCEYVTTVNTAGVMKVASSKKVEILGAPWAGFSPTENPAVKATDYAKASCLSEGDVLYVYDRANSNYLAWAVQPDGTWAAVKTYILDNGVVTESAADATRTNDIPRGVGVWLERKDPTKPIFLYGQVDASSVKTSLESGFNLVANPYPTEFDASKLAKPSVIGDKGDRIVIPTGGAPINAYYKDGSWGWYHDEEVEIVEGVWGVSSTWTTEGLTVPVGQGFWYLNSGTDAVELDWPTSAD